MKGAWNRECCFDDQSSIRIDRIFLATSVRRVSLDSNEYLLSYSQSCTHRSICKPYDVTILTVVVVCSEPVLSVAFRFFKRWYLWNHMRYQETVNGIHSCFSCTFIRGNKNFYFISNLIVRWSSKTYMYLRLLTTRDAMHPTKQTFKLDLYHLKS